MINWRQSGQSDTTRGADCVESTRLASAVGMRDSKPPVAARLSLSAQTIADLIARLKRDELNP
ncbi:DUF397 domain-containing protein [Actinomadura sp. 6N118]|uniref:DUF397 domain-containing protein n=1 Tax=Actinomadura sp. 6N118 TaxID=3375151 RepID=UPI00378FFBD1